MVDIFLSFKLQFILAVVFDSKWKHFFSSARTEKVGCGSASSQNWTEPSAHLPPLSLWLSDHLFAVICPFSCDAEKEAILEAPTEFHQHEAESHRFYCLSKQAAIVEMTVSN